MTKTELKELLTPEFLSTLHTAVECCNWDVDMVESMKFCDWCYGGKMTDMKTKAQKVLDAWGDAPFQIHDLIDVLRALVSDNEEWVDGTYMVKSEDILNIATELENL